MLDLNLFSGLAAKKLAYEQSYEFIVLELDKQFRPKPHIPIKKSITDDQTPLTSNISASIVAIQYINQIRVENGKNPLFHDVRAYDLSVVRAKDMYDYGYLDHKNPYTGSCPNNIKSKFGFDDKEHVIENAALYGVSGKPTLSNPIADDVIDAWMKSTGHKYNLLYYDHTGGAFSCHGGYCVFIGAGNGGYTGSVNTECHTLKQGQEFFSKFTGCSDEKMLEYESLQKEFKDLRLEYQRIPQKITSEIEHLKAEQLYDKLDKIKQQIDSFVCG
jgi:uncharacterized protein YkwD